MYWLLDIGRESTLGGEKVWKDYLWSKDAPAVGYKVLLHSLPRLLLLSDSVLCNGTYSSLLSHSTRQCRYMGHLRHFDLVKYSPVKN